jgi:hypothetical protein
MSDLETPQGSPTAPWINADAGRNSLMWSGKSSTLCYQRPGITLRSAMLPSSLALFLDLFVITIAIIGWSWPHTRSIMRRQSLYMLLVVQITDTFNNIAYM